MPFYRYEPPDLLRTLIECYWIIEDDDPEPKQQKIIPDGFPEIIFHYGDSYRINLGSEWEPQTKALLAGQLTKYFFLENTGRSIVFGIKFKPAAVTHLFNVSMRELTDKVVPLKTKVTGYFDTLEEEGLKTNDHENMIGMVNVILERLSKDFQPGAVDEAIRLIAETHGTVSVQGLTEQTATSERQLERLFNRYVGLSPKFYARVIRFSYIFQCIRQKDFTWTDLGLEAGFYDQPHFIKNFKVFTGEEPSRYFFDQPSLANFFMKKP